MIKEALRPVAVQQAWFDEGLLQVYAQNPGVSRERAVELTSRVIAPPWVAGHPTGGAIDVTLCTQNGFELDLGCAYGEDEKTSEGRCTSHCDSLTPAVYKRRLLFFAALESAGFVNYPNEWWHWSYGDRYWAAVTHRPSAMYGSVSL